MVLARTVFALAWGQQKAVIANKTFGTQKPFCGEEVGLLHVGVAQVDSLDVCEQGDAGCPWSGVAMVRAGEYG